MASKGKALELARTLLRLSRDDSGRISGERVSGVLAWVEAHRPPDSLRVLREYRRLVASEIAQFRAVVEFAGDVSPETFTSIAEAMSRRYGRSIQAVPVARPELIAGVRVRVGCDIFENTILSQLSGLASAS
jgi:F-type H+-transporting ATPase subunit delta